MSKMMDHENHIFLTSGRDKHSKEVSYPIGAEVLSRTLAGVPQHQSITCRFWASSIHHDLGQPTLHVLHAVYSQRERNFHDGKFARERGVLEPHWTITVFAVPRQLRGAIKLALIETSLPEIVRPWLIENSRLTGQSGDAGLTIEYVRSEQILKNTISCRILPERSC
jgi:hypothetical protein